MVHQHCLVLGVDKPRSCHQSLIADPIVRQLVFDLACYDWAVLSRCHTGHSRGAARLRDSSVFRDDPRCERSIRQTAIHIVNECPSYRTPGGLHTGLNAVD